MAEKIEVFFCYAREDEGLRLELEKHLSTLKRQHVIDLWHNQNISAGSDWKKEIDQHLNTAHVVLLLISPDFMASDYCFSVEMERAMERHSRGEVRVIPIILRAVYWQTTPFSGLQVLPLNAQPVTAWSDHDEAFFNVAEGIRHAIGELIIHRQARSISLFGYEMQGGKKSALWANPSTFSQDAAYKSWKNTKREFSRIELIDQAWVKTSNPEHTFVIHFSSDGSLKEYSLADPEDQWQGSWKLFDETLRINIGEYELDVFANQEITVHSGIEFMKGAREPHSYFACFPLPDIQIKHWDLNEVPELVIKLFDQVLHQQVDSKLLITYGSLLCRGEMSVRSIVKVLGLSQRYKEHFVDLKKVDETLELFYSTFLGRGADATGKQLYKKEIQVRGSNIVIADLIDSEEYRERFGEDTLPPKISRLKSTRKTV